MAMRKEGWSHEKSWLKFVNNMFEFVFSAMVMSSFVSNWNYPFLNELHFFNVALRIKYRSRFQVACRSTRRLGIPSTVA